MPQTTLQNIINDKTAFLPPLINQIQPVNQRGPTCGLYALTNLYRPLTGLLDWQATAGANLGGASLRKHAKQMGATHLGEIFDVKDMKRISESMGLAAEIVKVENNFDMFVSGIIINNIFILIPFSNQNGDPGFLGDRPHWALIIGANPTTHHIYATHWGKFWKWTTLSIVRSNYCIRDWVNSKWEKTGSGLRYRQVSLRYLWRKGYTFNTPLSQTLAKQCVLIRYRK